jgi:transcriptional regulator with XRE-family HTH domain
MMARRKEQLGDRIRLFRQQKGLSLTELATASGVSKGYLSSLENDPDDKRPSAQTLYAVATALGVAMSDLLGERLIIEPNTEVAESLRTFADEEGLPETDVQMLASIQFRGDRPKTPGRWRHIYEAIRMSRTLDR